MQTKNFADLITFTRATTATWWNPATSALEVAAINVPRLESLGLRYETQRTNNYQFNQDLSNAYWTKGAGAIASQGTVNGMPVFKFTPDTSNATHLIARALTMAAGTVVNQSWIIKPAGYNRASVRVAPGGTLLGRVIFDVLNGVIAQNSSNIAAEIIPLPNGFYRVAVTYPLGAGVTAAGANLEVATDANAITFAGDGTSGLLLALPQAEADSMSSVILTAAATVTRAADFAYIPATEWLRGGEGTLFAEVAHHWIGGDVASASLGVAANSGSILLWVRASDQRNSGRVYNDAGTLIFSSVPSGSVPVVTPRVPIKQVIAYAPPNGADYSTNGVIASNALPEIGTVDRLLIGTRGSSANHMTGHIRRIKYFPYRLTAAELQALTT